MTTMWPAEELEHLGRCPVCGDAGRTLAHGDLTDKLFHCSPDTWKLQACKACGTHYLDPRPTPGSIGRAYARYLTHDAPAAGAANAAGASPGQRVRHALRALANGYRNARWGTRFAPSHPMGRHLVPWIPFLRDALVQQFRSLPAAAPGARLLDVGCGNGAFMQLARDAGWSVQGMDFDAEAVAAARSVGLDVRQGGLERVEAHAPGSFAFVTLSHVLEHVHDPVAWLRSLHRVIQPSGTLWLQTPNIASLGHARYGPDWRGLEPPRHLTLWTTQTLQRVLQEVGFRQVEALKTPVVTAMEVYANSEALRRGMDYAAFAAVPSTQQRHPRHLWPALRQHASVPRAEFLTVIATR